MREPHGRVLILGGSTEAFALAEALSGRPGLEIVTSMAGRTKDPKLPAGQLRLGGFGGPEGLARYLQEERITALVDATHPFARQISRSAATAAATAQVPIIHFWRPEWRRRNGDQWIEVDGMAEAAAAIPEGASPAFLTVGRTELAPFMVRSDIRLLARVIDPVEGEDWPSNVAFIYDRGPFHYEAEKALFAEHGIRAVVTKNSGGEGARAKLDAARELALPVVMVRRPPTPAGKPVATADEALTWLADVSTNADDAAGPDGVH